MKWYLLFAGEDFADHSSGYLYESFDGEEFSVASMVDHAKTCFNGKAWMVLQSVEINPNTHETTIVKLWEKWEPLKKKIVLDPKKGKAKKSVAQKKAEALEQMNIFFTAAPQVPTAAAITIDVAAPINPEW